MIIQQEQQTKYVWTLCEFGEDAKQRRSITLPSREIIVGRSDDVDLTIPQGSVSKRHARITFSHGEMIVEDLGSTNGTHVNGRRIETSTVTAGDLLQFANAVYRVGRSQGAVSEGTMEEGILPWANTLLLFDRLVSERAVVPHFQPIVAMSDRKLLGYELLARSELDGLMNPALMFGAAERLGQQAVLSELMREEGVRIFSSHCEPGRELFVNTHPSEVVNDRFIQSLHKLRARCPVSKITVEIHEAAVTELESMKMLRGVLNDLNMKLSYDDFGAGQGRLLELSEIPPDVLKFDMQMIRNIDSASSSRQEMLAVLVRLARDLGSVPLAEGVETEQEHDACKQVGFQLGQGFLYGKPKRDIAN